MSFFHFFSLKTVQVWNCVTWNCIIQGLSVMLRRQSLLERPSTEYVSPSRVYFFSCSMTLTDWNVSCHKLNPLPAMSKYTCCFAARLVKNRAVLGIFFVVWFFSHTYTICNEKKFTHKISATYNISTASCIEYDLDN